jgi:signal transduction histidine kinase/ligand-binding sensor domain-containing protein
LPKLLFIFSFILSFTWNAGAQRSARFLHYSVKDGLSENSVHAIYRDHDGLVWIGTQDGLNSFDGKNFTVYRHDDNDSTTISDQFVVNIKEDNRGFLWIGTRNGLNRLNKHTGKFTRYYISEDEQHIFQAEYASFFLQADGKVAVPRDNYVMLIDPESRSLTKIYGPGSSYLSWHIFPDYSAWAADSSGYTYSTADLRKGRFASEGRAPFPLAKEPVQLSVRSGSSGMFFVHSALKPAEIFRFSFQEKKWLPSLHTNLRMIQMNPSGNGDLYISSFKGIEKISSAGTGTVIQNDPGNNNSLPPGNILCTYTDNEGNLWAGTAGNGLAVSNRSFENFLLIKAPVQNDVATAVARTSESTYIGSRNGLYKISNAQADAGLPPVYSTVLAGKGITALTADASENIWAGVQGEGIYVVNKAGRVIRTITTSNSSLMSTTIMHLCTDAAGRVLISTVFNFYIAPSLAESLIVFAPGSAHHIEGGYVMSSFAAKDGSIWVSNNLGLNVYDAALQSLLSLQSSDDKSSFLKRTIITSVAQDNSGTSWIGTIRDGIYKYKNGKAVHYNSSSGLSSDVIYNVLCDNRNRIWVTTSAGLNIFDAAHNCFTTLSTSDGIPNGAFIFGAAQKDHQGNILLGTSEGLLICYANKIELHQTNINALIEDVKINGQSISLNDNSFELIPDGKVINFTFASSPAFFSGNIIYQYRMIGQSNEWITLPQGVHTISYTGLPYRKLTLQVRAATAASNLESAHINTIAIDSDAPFYKTATFIIAAAILLLSLIIMLIMEYNRRSYKKQLDLLRIEKELQTERVRIGRDLHDNIGAYTSALIAGLNHINPNDAAQSQQIDDLKDYGVNIMGFLRETIWMLNTEILTITAFADRFKNYALRISKNYPDTDFKINEEIVNDKTLQPTLMLNLFRILQEALQNAYKHSKAQHISVSISSGERLSFTIKDTGRGFTNKAGNESYGLKNMQQRASEIGFELNIESGESGTTVMITENTANVLLAKGGQTS